jgi:hypothetical protein
MDQDKNIKYLKSDKAKGPLGFLGRSFYLFASGILLHGQGLAEELKEQDTLEAGSEDNKNKEAPQTISQKEDEEIRSIAIPLPYLGDSWCSSYLGSLMKSWGRGDNEEFSFGDLPLSLSASCGVDLAFKRAHHLNVSLGTGLSYVGFEGNREYKAANILLQRYEPQDIHYQGKRISLDLIAGPTYQLKDNHYLVPNRISFLLSMGMGQTSIEYTDNKFLKPGDSVNLNFGSSFLMSWSLVGQSKLSLGAGTQNFATHDGAAYHYLSLLFGFTQVIQ